MSESIGRTQTSVDWITPSRVAAWHATFDRADGLPRAGDVVPLGFHWTLAPALARESELGPDGHARRGGFLPALPLPKRLWAGSRVAFHAPLRVGDRVERESVITSVTEKQGRDTPLVFVTVRHRYTAEAGLAIEEEQDLVYREHTTGAADAERKPDVSHVDPPAWQRTIHPTETFLFRYSALTFNTHRIHYDRRYAMEVEGYAGLVVHGPLIATLLLDLAQTRVPAGRIERFQFKAMRPTFDTSDFTVCAKAEDGAGTFTLWSTDNYGARAVEAELWMRR